MDTKIFEYLLVIEETHNITTAAERCFVSQPALSKHLRNLEQEFGFPLFEKRKDGVYPTLKGQRCLDIARQMVNAEKETLRKIEDYKNASPKHLVVILEPSLRNIFTQYLAAISCAIPQCDGIADRGGCADGALLSVHYPF